MTEKLASTEIAQSRERFEKAFAAKYYTSDEIARRTMADLWEQAERDTRERIAQEIEEEAKNAMNPYAVKLMAERIRGKV